MNSVIEIKDLCVFYNSEPALTDINMSVGKGEFIGILGPNGSGKTTLLKTLLGLIKPSKGSITLFGNQPDCTSRRKTGYVPQKGNTDPQFPICSFDAVMMGRYPVIGIFKRPSEMDRSFTEESLRAVDAWHLRDRKIGSLSGGEAQRIWIARALVSRPEILLLDEPTTGLDLVSQGQIIDLIHHLHKDRGLTVLYVTHEINNVSCYLDKVAYLNKNLHAYGTPDEVIKVETLRSIYKGDVDVVFSEGKRIVIVGDYCHD